ncbi:MAG: aspartyl protease family protein [Rhodanobacter sp.]
MTMIRTLRTAVMGICLMLANQAWADSCKLMSYGTLQVTMVGEKPMTTTKINGVNTQFILDTGAFFNMMSRADALSLGLPLQPAPFGFRVGGIGGSASAQLTRVQDFGILSTTIKRVEFIVGGTDVGHGLLGANLLDVADLEIDLAKGKTTLFKPHDCRKESLAYWTKGGNYNVADIEPAQNENDRPTFLNVIIDGKKVRAVLDSGAASTLLTRAAAKRIGIDLDGPGVKSGSRSFGIGAKTVKTWTVPIATFSVGTETIQHSQMQVIDGRLGDTDMLLGVDFLLAHHVYIANSQRKMYFTYNGGRVFTFAKASDSSTPTETDTAMDNAGAGPKAASDYAQQGEASLSRGEPATAVADLSKAIQMAPAEAAYYVARARAYAAQKQIKTARADLDKSLSLDPKNVDALLLRATIRLAHKPKDRTGAQADVAAASALVVSGSPQARLIASLDIQLDHPAEALPLLDSWIHVHPDDAVLGVALNSRCWARSLTNQLLKKALHDCRKAISRDGKRPAYLDSLGLVELRLGNYPESIKAYQQAVALMPHSAWSSYGLGLAELGSGQAIAGKADIAIARALDPKIDTRAAKFGLISAGK